MHRTLNGERNPWNGRTANKQYMPIGLKIITSQMRCRIRTRNLVLTDQQERPVGKSVVSGHDQSGSEVLREGVRILEDNIQRRVLKMASGQITVPCKKLLDV